MRTAQFWAHGAKLSASLYLSNTGGQIFYAGIVVEIIGLVFYRRFPPAKVSDAEKEYRIEPMEIDDSKSGEDEETAPGSDVAG